MPKITKLWQLYILPLLVVGILLIGDQIGFFYNSNQPFDKIAEHTTALVEIDPTTLEQAYVEEVVDGDTIKLANGKSVRYIGIDTPETKHPSKPVQCYGKEASQKNKELVEGKTIYLEKDVSETDRYDRLLRYIYLPNPEDQTEALFVNEYLVEQGYAKILTYPPDVKYHEVFQNALQKAQKEQRGLWGTCTK
ncbi:thermonuclease family protein [Candidatus Woesebacteria bacterium]|nr:thermonuclease family protein [Candidatus Woesebacteria bacterium]